MQSSSPFWEPREPPKARRGVKWRAVSGPHLFLTLQSTASGIWAAPDVHLPLWEGVELFVPVPVPVPGPGPGPPSAPDHHPHHHRSILILVLLPFAGSQNLPLFSPRRVFCPLAAPPLLLSCPLSLSFLTPVIPSGHLAPSYLD